MAQFRRQARLPAAFTSAGAALRARKTGIGPTVGVKATVDRPILIRPIVDPAPMRSDVFPREPAPPAASPGRLTAILAIDAGREKARARAFAAGPQQAEKAYRRESKGAAIARIAVATDATRKNPAPVTGDLVTGMARFTSAFERQPFRTPFQASYNLRRSYGA